MIDIRTTYIDSVRGYRLDILDESNNYSAYKWPHLQNHFRSESYEGLIDNKKIFIENELDLIIEKLLVRFEE